MLDAWEKTEGRSAPHRRRDIICTNPVSGTADGAAAPADNPGTLVPTRRSVRPQRLSSAGSARVATRRCCELDGAIPALGPYVLPGNNYHVYDYALFWGAVRRDAGRRLAAWRRE